MYTVLYLTGCGYSRDAIDLLESRGLDCDIITFSNNVKGDQKIFIKELNEEYKMELDSEGKKIFDKKVFKDFYGKETTFPRIYKDGELVGGYDQLEESL